MDQTSKGEASLGPEADEASIAKIHQLLKAKDDTQNFVGLALLKSVLDNSPQLRDDENVLRELWSSLSVRFLDRLLRTGSKTSRHDAKEMLNLAVSVLHTFAVLLPESSRGDAKFTDRISGLVAAVLCSSQETTELLLQLLYTLVSTQQGALAFVNIEDVSALTEIAPSHAVVMDILGRAWLNVMATSQDRTGLLRQMDGSMQNLVSSFSGTDAVTLLEFIGPFLQQSDPAAIQEDPKWLVTVVGMIRKLTTSRPSPQARAAYTNAAASLLQTYPTLAPPLFFKAEASGDKPFAYLFVNLVLIDIRSSAPTLLEEMNTPEYRAKSRRLCSAFDIICIFTGYLVRSLDDDSFTGLIMAPDSLLKLRRAVSETMSVTIEYLRDRWDATFAGAMGLHPDARSRAAETATGSHRTLAWDSLDGRADRDPLVLAAIRALALWLREDDGNEMLCEEATGLTDMLVELYQASSSPDQLDFRSPVLLAMEALAALDTGRDLLLRNNAWQALSRDLGGIIRTGQDAARGTEIVRVLLQLAEQTHTDTAEEWMDVVTAAAAWDLSLDAAQLGLPVAVLQLCCALLDRASHGLRRRYVHSTTALAGLATQLEARIAADSALREAIEDVSRTLDGLRRA